METTAISPCGVARLFAALGEHDQVYYLNKLGVKVHTCPKCKKLELPPGRWRQYFPYCSKHCREVYEKWIMLECDECGVLFRRKAAVQVYRSGKRGSQYIFCSRTCLGRHAARVYGFLARYGPMKMLELICEQCGKRFSRGKSQHHSRRSFCSLPCYRRFRRRWGL